MDRVLVILIRSDLLPVDISLKGLFTLELLVFPPRLLPLLNGLLGDAERILMTPDRSEDLVHHIDDFLRRSVRNIEITRKDPLAGALVVVVEDVEEELRIASPPGVDRLLGVPHIEERTLPPAVLDHLVDKGTQDLPLDPAGVLKLVQEPVVELRIEPVPGARDPVHTPHLRGKQIGHVRKGHPAPSSGERVVGALKLLHEAAEGGALFQERFVDRLQQRE